MPTRKRQHGFTIVELMVTMAILGLMLFLINEIFNDTSVAVTTSVQVSKTVAASRSINEQFTDDADAMLGPGISNNGGYIVIIQQKLPAVPMLNPQTLAEVPNPVELRTDQLLFIRDAEGLRSMTPSSASSYGTSIIGQASDRAKVWYGHVQRTAPDGSVTGTSAAFQLGGASARLDRIGSDFILGRQAMLFKPASLDTSTDTYANNAYYTSIVSGLGTGAPANRTWNGFTDVTFQNYGPASDTSSLLYQITDTTTLSTAVHTSNYRNTAYPNAASRLRVNPAPDADDTDYASWAIAQGHAILAPNCSEILIDFAADLNGNGRIDRATAGGTLADDTGAIYWYDTLRRPILPITDYSWDNPGTGGQPLINTVLGDQNVFIFRVDDDQEYTATGSPVSSWPYLIRIRYRLHDTRGRLTSGYAAAGRDGLDNDGDGGIDGSDPLSDEERISGRWFERIITVPRP